MLKRLKSQQPSSFSSISLASDVVDLLGECHERIRRFLDIADRLVLQASTAVPESDIRETALAVHCYFSQALPLHVRDEEETVKPRLRGRELEVDEALVVMSKEHEAHEPVLRRFLALSAALAEAPARHETLCEELRPIAMELRAQLEAHLQAEEQMLFPAVGRLCDAHTQAAMVAELRRRRAV